MLDVYGVGYICELISACPDVHWCDSFVRHGQCDTPHGECKMIRPNSLLLHKRVSEQIVHRPLHQRNFCAHAAVPSPRRSPGIVVSLCRADGRAWASRLRLRGSVRMTVARQPCGRQPCDLARACAWACHRNIACASSPRPRRPRPRRREPRCKVKTTRL